MRCGAHLLQLATKSSVKKCKVLDRALEKLASIISSVHKSTQLSDKVRADFQKVFVHRTLTRFHSNFKMSRRAVQFDCSKSTLPQEYRLSGGQIDVLKDFVELMEPFEEAFLRLQQKSHPSICDVLPIIYLLRKYLQAS